MSLTSFLDNEDVKQRFREEFVAPNMSVKLELLAPPLSKRYSLVGTAFDYLMRFYLKWLNPNAVTRPWIAERVLEDLFSLDGTVIDSNGEVVDYNQINLTKRSQRIIQQAKAHYEDYLSSGQITDQLIESAIRLAQLDPIFRAGFVDENLGTVYKEDVDDLRELISHVEPQHFRASRLCLLNPEFGEATRLVGGADADLVIDDAIIDIKTTKNLKLERRSFNQLIGYFILHEIAGVGGLIPRPEITKVGIYFSRYGFLYLIKLSDVICPETFPAFVEWFITRAKQQYAFGLPKLVPALPNQAVQQTVAPHVIPTPSDLGEPLPLSRAVSRPQTDRMNENKLQSPQHTNIRTLLRVGGPLIVGVGLFFIIVGFGSFWASFGSLEPRWFFWCVFIGMPVLLVGILMCKLGWRPPAVGN